METQLKRGILNMCILRLLCDSDKYGYDIVKKMKEYYPDTDESTFYAILRRLNKEELTDMYYSDVSLGPKRKYYRITEKGREYLENYIVLWKEINRIFGDMGIL